MPFTNCATFLTSLCVQRDDARAQSASKSNSSRADEYFYVPSFNVALIDVPILHVSVNKAVLLEDG